MGGYKSDCEKIVLSSHWKNSSGKKPPQFELAEDFIYFLVILPLLFYLLLCMKANMTAYISCVLVPFNFAAVTVCRQKAKKESVFLLLLVVVTAVMMVVQIYFGNSICAFTALAAAIFSFCRKERTIEKRRLEAEHTPVNGNAYLDFKILIVGGLCCFLVYFLSYFFGYRWLFCFSVADFAALFISYVIYRNKSGAVCLSNWNKDAPNKTGRISGALFCFWTVAGVAVLSVFSCLFVALTGLTAIDGMINNILFSPYAKKLAIASGQIPNIPDNTPPPADHRPMPTPTFPAGLKVLLYICAVILAVFLLIVLSRLFIWICKKLWPSNEERKSLFSVKEAAEEFKARAKRVTRDLGERMGAKGNREQIRQLFLAHVKSHRARAFISRSDSPHEITDKLAEAHNGTHANLERAAELYEKARYSTEACSDTDLSDMKKSLNP